MLEQLFINTNLDFDESLREQLLKTVDDLNRKFDGEVNKKFLIRVTVLHIACFIGCEPLIRFLVDVCPSLINQVDLDGRPPLFYLIKKYQPENLSMIELLISKGTIVPLEFKWADSCNCNLLHVAAAYGNRHVVDLILNESDLLNKKDSRGRSAIYYSLTYKNFDTFEYLIEKNADLTHKFRRCKSTNDNLLHLAVSLGKTETVDVIIKKIPELVHWKNSLGQTPIVYAFEANNMTIIKLLLDNEAELDIQFTWKGFENNNLLHVAASHNNIELAELLLSKHPELLDLRDAVNCAPIYYAVDNSNTEMVNYLLSKNADISFLFYMDGDGCNLLHLAAYNGIIDIAKALLHKDPELLNRKSKSNCTPLFYAIEEDNDEMIKFLLSKDVDVSFEFDSEWEHSNLLHLTTDTKLAEALLDIDPELVNKKNSCQLTPLYNAVEQNNIEMVQLLIRRNADVSFTFLWDNLGSSLLHVAAFYNYTEIAQLLINQDPSLVNLKNAGNLPPLHYALEQRNDDMVVLLLENNAIADPKTSVISMLFYLAAENEKVAKLIQNKCPDLINKMTSENFPLLFVPVNGNSYEKTKWYIEQGADVSVQFTWHSSNTTILHVAATKKDTRIAELILSKNRELVNLPNGNNMPPLFYAVKFRNPNMISLLLNNNAEIDYLKYLKGMSEDSPLHVAAELGHLQLAAKVLEKYPDQVNRLNVNEQTPLVCAALNKRYEMVKFLRSNNSDIGVRFTWIDRFTNLLHVAAAQDDQELANDILTIHPNILNTITSGGKTPLYYAVVNNNVNMAQILLEKRADESHIVFRWEWCDRNTLIHIAADKGLTEVIKVITDKDPELLNVVNSFNQPPVLYAIKNNHEDTLKYFLDEDCDLSLEFLWNGVRGMNLLHVASVVGNLEMVELILKKNPELINKKNEWNQTPIVCASIFEHQKIVQFLLDNNADCSVKFMWNWANDNNLLHVLCFYGNIELIDTILRKYPNLLNDKNENNRTPISFAIQKRHTELSKYLIHMNCDVSTSFKFISEQNNLLHIACLTYQDEIVQILLGKDPNLVNATDSWNRPPILYAVLKGNLDLVDILLENNADASILFKWGCHNMSLLHVCRYEKISERILKAYPHLINVRNSKNMTPIVYAMNNVNKSGMAQFFLKHNADISVKFEWDGVPGSNLMHVVASLGYLNIATKIYAKNPDLIKQKNSMNQTPIVEAIINDQLLVFNWITYTNPNFANERCDYYNIVRGSLLHISVCKGFMKISQNILAANSRLLDEKDVNGYTPLAIAVQENQDACVDWLINQNANCCSKTNKGRNLWHVLAESAKGKVSTANLLYPHCSKLITETDIHGRTALKLLEGRKTFAGKQELLKWFKEKLEETNDEVTNKESDLGNFLIFLTMYLNYYYKQYVLNNEYYIFLTMFLLVLAVFTSYYI